jgi:2-oxoglutarate dehydrogenase E2 component (dihydrolipoamide succinyltransferase)
LIRNEYKEAFKAKHAGVSLGYVFFAVTRALKLYPDVNSMMDGDYKIAYDFCDISIAVSGPKGLMVPVVRNAENLSFRGVEADIKRLAIKARDGQITVDDMTGGTLLLLMVVFWKYVVQLLIHHNQRFWECTTLLNVQLL